jgi:hypothetical protein
MLSAQRDNTKGKSTRCGNTVAVRHPHLRSLHSHPTDDAYADDQRLETELLTLLDDLLAGLTAEEEE